MLAIVKWIPPRRLKPNVLRAILGIVGLLIIAFALYRLGAATPDVLFRFVRSWQTMLMMVMLVIYMVAMIAAFSTDLMFVLVALAFINFAASKAVFIVWAGQPVPQWGPIGFLVVMLVLMAVDHAIIRIYKLRWEFV